MLVVPVPLFKIQEWGTRRLHKGVCPRCGKGKLQAVELVGVSSGLPVNTYDYRGEKLVGTNVVHVFHHDSVDEPIYAQELTLECDACQHYEVAGWKRWAFQEKPPQSIKGSDVTSGSLYGTLQHYLTPPEDENPFHLADFWIDIDRGSDLTEATNVAKRVCDFLDSQESYYELFYSGSKGYHIVVPWNVLGAAPSKSLSWNEYKQLALALEKELHVVLDKSVYSRRRMFRLENTQHEKTGSYKVQLLRSELELPLAQLVALANTPRHFLAGDTLKNSGSYAYPSYSEKLAEFYEAALITNFEAKVLLPPSTFKTTSLTPCVETALDEGPPESGLRHDLTLNMATYWARSDLPEEDLLRWARDVPGASNASDGERVREAKNLLKWAKRSKGKFSCKKMKELGWCKPECPFHNSFHEDFSS